MKKSIQNKKTVLLLIILIFLTLSFYPTKAQEEAPDYTYCQKNGAIDCSLNLDETACRYDTNCRWDNTIKTPGLCGLKLEVGWPDSPAGTSISRCSTVTGMVKYFYDWAISLGGLAAFIVLIFAGFQYITSAGNPTAMGEAKSRIQSAVLGIILLLGSWLILNTINPQLTTLTEPTLKPVSPDLPSLKLSKEKMIPCEFAILYPVEDWKGSVEKKLTVSDGQKFVRGMEDSTHLGLTDFNSYVIYRTRQFTDIECETDKKEGEDIVQECRDPDPDDELTEKFFLEYCKLKSGLECIKDPDTYSYNNYISGGACIMEIYYPSSWWTSISAWAFNECGDKMGSLGTTAVDKMRSYTSNPADIKCLKLTKIKTPTE